MSTFAERLKSMREQKGLTQDALAKLIDRTKSQSVIASLESGANKSSSYIPEIARALGVDSYWLKTGKGQPNASNAVLTDDERTLLAGFALMGEEMRQSWLETAQRTIEKATATKKAIDAMDAAKRKAA